MTSRPGTLKERAATARYADMFAALGIEVRLRILRLLLSAHPRGMFVGDIQADRIVIDDGAFIKGNVELASSDGKRK